ncbi:TetR/AcrR family transcriptional regulator [Patulibacter defluvii]|uniref:TetR/AcrR family transcriptional regulator n=1 Tax=Patulibacter defluvii TaxID=3095358 RepID=UPI002A76218D|nr:TetR family transcriptional regulator [Patulibacter sp. DM4]
MAADPDAPRRSPAPEVRRRDADRTREALLDAAKVEFAAKGLAGARVSEIAARAGVNKQLISYYFGGKAGLHQALLDRWKQQEADFTDPAEPIEELVLHYLDYAIADPEMLRFFFRETLAEDPAAIPGPDEAGVPDDVQDLARRQREGEFAADVDPAFLLLVLQAAVGVGVTFPGDVKRMTGHDPQSPAFRAYMAEQLRTLLAHLRP